MYTYSREFIDWKTKYNSDQNINFKYHFIIICPLFKYEKTTSRVEGIAKLITHVLIFNILIYNYIHLKENYTHLKIME